MTNFVLLYSGGGPMPATETEQKAILKDWDTWFGKLGSSLVDGGNPFSPKAKAIASDGKVSDTPMANMSTGYSVIKADSIDSAVGLAKGCPVLKSGGKITVFETFRADGM